MEESDNDYFWPSYVDFMMVLFFIALGIGGYMYIEYSNEIEGLKSYQKFVDQANSINTTLRQNFQKKNIQIDTSAKDKIKLSGDFYFNTNRDNLKDQNAINQIVAIGLTIKTILDSSDNRSKYAILIEGHTDDIGDEEYNNNLSYRRALSIAKIWKDDCRLSLPKYEVVPSGFGEFKPIKTNIDDLSRSINRRIEISIIPEFSEFTKLVQQQTNNVPLHIK